MHECVHTRPSVTRSLIHRQQVVFLQLAHWRIHRKWSVWVWANVKRWWKLDAVWFFNREAIIVGFVTGFASHLLVTQCFLFILFMQPLVQIAFVTTACAVQIYTWKCVWQHGRKRVSCIRTSEVWKNKIILQVYIKRHKNIFEAP